MDRSFIVDPLCYFSFQSMLHDWNNKGRCMSYTGMLHIKEPLLLIRVAHVVEAGFLSRYLNGSLPYVRRHISVNVLSASLNKTLLSFLHLFISFSLSHWVI